MNSIGSETGSDRAGGSDFGSDVGSDFGSGLRVGSAERVKKMTGACPSRAGNVAARGRRVTSLSDFRWRVRPLWSSDLGEIFTVALLTMSTTHWYAQIYFLSTLISGPIWLWPLFLECLVLLGSDTTVGGVGMFEVTSGAPLREKRTLKSKGGEAFKKTFISL